MSDDRRLHVFHDASGYDWVVAYDAEDATAVYEEACGEWDGKDFGDTWDQLDDAQSLGVWQDEDNLACGCETRRQLELQGREQAIALVNAQPPTVRGPLLSRALSKFRDHRGPFGHYKDCPVGYVRKTCAEWVAAEGRGFLCSTES